MPENETVKCCLCHDKYMQVESSFVLGTNKGWRDWTALQPPLVHGYIRKEVNISKINKAVNNFSGYKFCSPKLIRHM